MARGERARHVITCVLRLGALVATVEVRNDSDVGRQRKKARRMGGVGATLGVPPDPDLSELYDSWVWAPRPGPGFDEAPPPGRCLNACSTRAALLLAGG